MLHQRLIVYITILALTFSFIGKSYGSPKEIESFEDKRIEKIVISIENLPKGAYFNPQNILSHLHIKTGDPFSQQAFDHDLKVLGKEYDRIEPSIKVGSSGIQVTIKLWKKPLIRDIQWEGNTHIKTKALQKELGVQSHTIFNREEFKKGLNQVKEYYIKKGFFECHLDYIMTPIPDTNEIDIKIQVHEGKSGHIKKIILTGFDREEESEIIGMINTKKYNFFTSWLTGMGTYHEEALDHDKLVIVNFLQNRGYADARVTIQIKESEDGKLEIYLHAFKGDVFHYKNVTFSGNHLITNEQIKQVLLAKEGAIYSPENLRDSAQNIKDLYGKDGYIESQVNYTLKLAHNKPLYDVHFQIEEGDQFRVGMIRVLGNTLTNKKVILHESLLVPGEVFDSRRLRQTQQRLEAMNYFKSVNVYPVRASEDQDLGENYRDVIIEVEEAPTGNLSLFFGLSSAEDIFGGLDLAENNFNYKGLSCFWKDGLSALRGGGEYAHARAQIGRKQQNYSVAWLTPYWRDSLWRVGFDTNYAFSRVQSDDYSVHTIGGSLFGSYPLSSYWTYGWKYRVRNAIINVSKSAGLEALEEEKNSGLVMGLGTSLGYDSTDNAYKPHSGFRSTAELELGGVRRHAIQDKDFPFFRLAYLNTYYYPIWKKGTLKIRGDLRFLYPFDQGRPELVPISERFFLGGETTVRGYRPFCIGPKFKKHKTDDQGKETIEEKDPTGGISSALFSVEYLQQLYKMIDLFVFFDGGSISMKRFDIPNFKMSYGFGTRLELANRIPVTLGVGFPIKLKNKDDKKPFFFSMGGQF